MSQSNIPQITAEEVQKAIVEKKDYVLLDVRTGEEFVRGKIDGSINIPVDELINKICEIVPDKN